MNMTETRPPIEFKEEQTSHRPGDNKIGFSLFRTRYRCARYALQRTK